MKTAVTSLILCILCGCAGSPPKPPKCLGEFRPINAHGQQAALGISARTNLCEVGGEHVKQG